MIQQNVSLKPYNTFGINVNAEAFASVKTLEDLKTTLKNRPSKILIIGGGSNILLTEEIPPAVVDIRPSTQIEDFVSSTLGNIS